MAVCRNFLVDDAGSQGATTEVRVRSDFFKAVLFCTGVDSENSGHAKPQLVDFSVSLSSTVCFFVSNSIFIHEFEK